jgi:cyanate permease
VYGCSALITPTLDLPTLLPLYLDTLGLDSLRIGWLGSLFSLAAVPAVLGGGWLHQRLESKQRKWFYVPLLCLSACGLHALSTVQGYSPRSAAARVLLPSTLVAIMSGMSPAFYIRK